MEQTAVEWQFEQMFNSFEKFNNGECTFNDFLKRNLEIREQAKEMEKEQKIQAQIEILYSIGNNGANAPLYGVLKTTLLDLQEQLKQTAVEQAADALRVWQNAWAEFDKTGKDKPESIEEVIEPFIQIAEDKEHAAYLYGHSVGFMKAKEQELDRLKEAYSMGRTGKSIEEFNKTFKPEP